MLSALRFLGGPALRSSSEPVTTVPRAQWLRGADE